MAIVYWCIVRPVCPALRDIVLRTLSNGTIPLEKLSFCDVSSRRLVREDIEWDAACRRRSIDGE